MRPLLVGKGRGIGQNLAEEFGVEPGHGEGGFAARALPHGDPTRGITGQADAGHLLDQGKDLGLYKFGVEPVYAIVFKPALAPLCVLAAVLDGDGHHRGDPPLINQIIEGRE